MGYDLRFIKQTLYTLKREYGVPLNIIWRTSSVADLETGRKTVTKDSILVERGIVLPSKIERDFVYDLTFIASNKNFTYGGLFNLRQRRIVIDRADLPTDFEIKVGHYLVYNKKRYDVKEVEEFEHGACFVVLAEQADSVDLENYIKRHMFSALLLEHSVEVEIE